MAARSFGGDSGRLVMRTPMARLTALATAASGGTIGTSPTPLAPNGWRGLGNSIRNGSITGRHQAPGVGGSREAAFFRPPSLSEGFSTLEAQATLWFRPA